MDISAILKRICILLIISLLAACGGGGSSTPKSPDLSISPSVASYNFGNIELYSKLDGTFTITNTGDANLTVGDISISPAGPFSVQTDTCSNETLAPNESCSFTASFSPTSRDQSTATLSVPSNDPAGTATIALSGGGIGSKVSLSESSYDFGGIVINNSQAQTLMITNTGNSSLTIEDFSSWESGPFSIISDSDTCSNMTLAANGTCSFTARFSPTDQVTYAATLSIQSDDPDGAANVDMSGEGYGLNVWISNLQIDFESCDTTLEVTVTDPTTGEFKNLLKEDFTLTYENETGVQVIDTFSNFTTVPVSTVLALDWSGSEAGVIENIYTAANSFLALFTDADDEAAAYKFNGDIDFYPDAITGFYQLADLAILQDYIDNDFTGSGGTKLYDVLYQSIERASTAAIGQRAAVVVLSDGHDEGSVYTLDDVIAYANTEEIPIFSIYYFDPDFEGGTYGRPDEVMQPLATETGGQYYDGSTGTLDLSDVYGQVSSVLNNKSTMTFTKEPCSSGTFTLEVEVNDDMGNYGKGFITFTIP